MTREGEKDLRDLSIFSLEPYLPLVWVPALIACVRVRFTRGPG